MLKKINLSTGQRGTEGDRSWYGDFLPMSRCLSPLQAEGIAALSPGRAWQIEGKSKEGELGGEVQGVAGDPREVGKPLEIFEQGHV